MVQGIARNPELLRMRSKAHIKMWANKMEVGLPRLDGILDGSVLVGAAILLHKVSPFEGHRDTVFYVLQGIR